MPEAIVYRLIEYRGPRQWVTDTVARSLKGNWETGTAEHRGSITAREVTLLSETSLSTQMVEAREWPCVWEGRQGPGPVPEEV